MKITPFLWFNDNVQEAIDFYSKIFPDTKVLFSNKYAEGGPKPAGTILTATISLCGQELILLNGGPEFQFNESFSLFVSCDTQEEVDRLWNALTADGGQEGQCGWLKDKFGLSWQIIPTALGTYLSGQDPEKTQRAFNAMMQMHKIDTKKLEEAYNG